MPNTIAEMMDGYANQAVQHAAEFEITLDYSEDSLRLLEEILARLQASLPNALHANSSGDPAQQEIDSASRIWGGYFGETIRRLWGGDWGVETYPGTVAPVISIDVGGAKLFPIMKIYRRLTNGDSEDVWKFYQMVREKVSGQGSKQ